MLLRKQAIKRYFILPPHLPNASALPGKMPNHKNCIFFFRLLYYCIARLQPVFGLNYSVLLLTTMLLYDS